MEDALPNLFNMRRVNADHERLDSLDAAHELRIGDVVGAFAPAADALIGVHADEDPSQPGVHMHYVSVDIRNLHVA